LPDLSSTFSTIISGDLTALGIKQSQLNIARNTGNIQQYSISMNKAVKEEQNV